MATVINNPGGESSDSGMGIIVGVIIAIVLIALFFISALPALRNREAPAGNQPGINVNVTAPSPSPAYAS